MGGRKPVNASWTRCKPLSASPAHLPYADRSETTSGVSGPAERWDKFETSGLDLKQAPELDFCKWAYVSLDEKIA